MPVSLFGKEKIVLKDSINEFEFTKFEYSMYEDHQGNITIDDILTKKLPFKKKS